jgi:transcriptional regulator with XRE-family HTH domain
MRFVTIAKRIRKARLQAGLTQEALAREAGTSTRNIARWESGRTIPRLEHREALARALGLAPDFFGVGISPGRRETKRLVSALITHLADRYKVAA